MSAGAITEFKIVEASAKRFAKGLAQQAPLDEFLVAKSSIIAAPRWRSRIARNSASCFSTRRTA